MTSGMESRTGTDRAIAMVWVDGSVLSQKCLWQILRNVLIFFSSA